MDLTTTSVYTKRIVIVITVAMVLLLILRVILTIASGIIHNIQSNQPYKPTNGFGKLPALNIPSLTLPPGDSPQYILDTPTGTIPAIPTFALVYPYVQQSMHLTSYENADNIASSLLFADPSTPLSKQEYQWHDDVRSLYINIDNQNFSITSNPQALMKQNSTSDGNGSALVVDGSFIEQLKSNINNFRKITDDYMNGTYTTEPLYIDPSGNIQKPSVQNPPNAGYINLFRSVQEFPNNIPGANKSSLQILGPNPLEGNIHGIIMNNAINTKNSVLNFSLTDWTISPISSAQSYTLTPVSTAWNELKSGQGKLVYLYQQNSLPVYIPTLQKVSSFSIQQIYLAYYDSVDPQKYLQPIYVFQGIANLADGTLADFYYYIPAIQ